MLLRVFAVDSAALLLRHSNSSGRSLRWFAKNSKEPGYDTRLLPIVRHTAARAAGRSAVRAPAVVMAFNPLPPPLRRWPSLAGPTSASPPCSTAW